MYENAAVASKAFGRYCTPQSELAERKRRDDEWAAATRGAPSRGHFTLEISSIRIRSYVLFNTRCLMRDIRALWIIYNILKPPKKKKISRTRMNDENCDWRSGGFYEITKWVASIFICPLYSCSRVMSISSVYTHFSRWCKFLATLTILRMRVIVTVHFRLCHIRHILRA